MSLNQRSTHQYCSDVSLVAYRDAIEYLWEQKHPRSTFTICTGAQGDLATFALPALTQGPLFSMATAAARENEKTNVRFNEVPDLHALCYSIQH